MSTETVGIKPADAADLIFTTLFRHDTLGDKPIHNNPEVQEKLEQPDYVASDRHAAANVNNFCSYPENSFFKLCDPDMLRGIVAKNELAHEITRCAVNEQANKDSNPKNDLNEKEFNAATEKTGRIWQRIIDSATTGGSLNPAKLERVFHEIRSEKGCSALPEF